MYRLRKVWPEYQGRMRLTFRALSLELKNRKPTPKPILDIEFMLQAQQDHDLPIHPWRSPDWQFVPTFLPAFEAGKAAALQGDEAAWSFEWHVRHAFFYESRIVCMRYELEKVARQAGLDVDRFLRDWDSGLLREPVIAESRRGWEELKVEGSPTFVLPSGKQFHNPAAWQVTWSKDHLDVQQIHEPDYPDGNPLNVFRAMLDEVLT